jgi:hypothetical protein
MLGSLQGGCHRSNAARCQARSRPWEVTPDAVAPARMQPTGHGTASQARDVLQVGWK